MLSALETDRPSWTPRYPVELPMFHGATRWYNIVMLILLLTLKVQVTNLFKRMTVVRCSLMESEQSSASIEDTGLNASASITPKQSGQIKPTTNHLLGQVYSRYF